MHPTRRRTQTTNHESLNQTRAKRFTYAKNSDSCQVYRQTHKHTTVYARQLIQSAANAGVFIFSPDSLYFQLPADSQLVSKVMHVYSERNGVHCGRT